MRLRTLITEPLRMMKLVYWMLMLRSYGVKLKINGDIQILTPENVEIGDDVSINAGTTISGVELIIIEDHVRISPNVCITSSGLNLDEPYDKRGHKSAPIRICKGAWLGAGCTILPGVTVGEGAVVGAGAVVTHDVEPFTVVVGVPTKILKRLK